MADDKKNIGPEVETPAEAPAPEQPVPDKPEPVVGDPAPAEKAEPVVSESPGAAAPEAPAPDKQAQQTAIPGMDGPAPASPSKVVDFAAAREGAARDKTPDQQAAKPRRGRPPKEDKGEKPAKGKAKAPRDKMSQSKGAASKASPAPAEAPTAAEPTPEQPPVPRDAARSAEPEQIVYINLSELHAFKNHPFGVRDDTEMQGLVESVKASGVNQPALVRPREEGGYEIVAGHRRQRASELAGYANMPCIVRNMTDDEARGVDPLSN